jgi:CubicO group peptidase (beta-lactamase class C family)
VNRLVLVAVVALLTHFASSPDTASLDTTASARVDQLFAPWNKPDSPGCSLGVSQNGVPVYEHGYGMANLELRVPITPASVFHVASVSKQFTAMSILLLAQRGQLSLDDDARKYVTGLPDYGSRLTLRHLLSHTSGLRDAFLLLGLSPPREDDADPNEEIVRLLTRQRGLNFAPGTDFRYNNGGYTMLGAIVRRVSGQSLHDFAAANIFKPLGMTSTHFHDDPTLIVPNRASGYDRKGGAFHRALRGDPMGLVGNAGLMTTAPDLLRWEQNFADARVGDATLLAAMQTPGTLTTGEKLPYGFGVWVGEHHGLRTIEHGGGDPGVSAYVLRYPDRGLAVALLCNLDDIDAPGLAKQVSDIYLGDAATAATSPPAPRPVPVTAGQLASRAGLYRMESRELFMRLVVRDGKLVGIGNAGEEGDSFPLTPVSANRFIIPGSEAVFAFAPSADGQPDDIHVTGDGLRPYTLRRVTATFTPSSAALRAFAGDYISQEIDGTFIISARDAGLVLQMPGRSDTNLRPIFPDAFQGGAVDVIEFSRDPQGAVTGFTVNAGGAQGLRFDRVKR